MAGARSSKLQSGTPDPDVQDPRILGRRERPRRESLGVLPRDLGVVIGPEGRMPSRKKIWRPRAGATYQSKPKAALTGAEQWLAHASRTPIIPVIIRMN